MQHDWDPHSAAQGRHSQPECRTAPDREPRRRREADCRVGQGQDASDGEDWKPGVYRDWPAVHWRAWSGVDVRWIRRGTPTQRNSPQVDTH